MQTLTCIKAPTFSLTASVSTSSQVTTPVPPCMSSVTTTTLCPSEHLITDHPWPPRSLLLSILLKHTKLLPLALVPSGRWAPYQGLVVNLLSDELVLTERVASLSCDGVNGAFLHLLLDGTEEGEERLACTLLQGVLERRKFGKGTV